MAQEFTGRVYSVDGGATDGAAITPNDGADLPTVARALYIGGAGNVAGVTFGGTTLTFVGLQAGTTLPVAFRRINATGTTATNLVALF